MTGSLKERGLWIVRRVPCGPPRLPKIAAIVSKLLQWYRKNARDLPWRGTNDPYAIWVSEVMLQQTQVKTVIPYWVRWMKELPTIQALARARIDRVLKLWEGLGYYSRARNLQKGAQIIVKEHGGEFPRKFAEVLELPGIGRYTAGAICSIAFDEPRPILDGNVMRVLARLYAITGNPKEPRANERLWALAEQLVVAADATRINGERPCSDLSQALMELGATICTPVEPKCASCPVQRCCVALARRAVHRFPQTRRATPSTQRRFVAAVVQRNRKFLVRQRSDGVVNGGLWEFPNVEVGPEESVESALKRLINSAESSRLLTIRHTITRYRITLDVFEAKEPQTTQEGRWRSAAELEQLAFSSAHRQIVKHLTEGMSHNRSSRGNEAQTFRKRAGP